MAFFLILVSLPFVDRNPKRWWRHRPVAMTLALLMLLALIALSIIMILTPAKNHLGM